MKCTGPQNNNKHIKTTSHITRRRTQLTLEDWLGN